MSKKENKGRHVDVEVMDDPVTVENQPDVAVEEISTSPGQVNLKEYFENIRENRRIPLDALIDEKIRENVLPKLSQLQEALNEHMSLVRGAIQSPKDLKPDPWRHRSKGMRCATCIWWVQKKQAIHHKITVGRCRRRAPTMDGYPVVFDNDWCGDHKLDEDKF